MSKSAAYKWISPEFLREIKELDLVTHLKDYRKTLMKGIPNKDAELRAANTLKDEFAFRLEEIRKMADYGLPTDHPMRKRIMDATMGNGLDRKNKNENEQG